MLTSTLGARLVLMVGKFSPLPAPAVLTQAIERLEVTVSSQGETGFQITFRVSKNQLGEYNLLSGLSPVSLEPYSRVIIGVLMGLTTRVLIDGIITYQELSPSPQYGQATLTVSGTDLSTLLDRTELTASYCCLPDSAIVQEILLRYLEYGIVATATPTPNVPTPTQRLVWQQGTDLEFIQMLAQRNGYIFYLESQLPMVNRAYFGPDVRLSEIQPALTMDMGADNNLLSINFSHDGKRPMVVTGQMGIPGTAGTVPFALPALAMPPLALRPTLPARTRTLRETAKYDPMQTTSAVQSVQRAHLDSVTASGSVDAFRYGHVMRPRRLIGVRGAGFSYDGLYWVSRVTHVIERDSYTQSFALSREGLGSLTPVVRP
jgi:hypothetical protein